MNAKRRSVKSGTRSADPHLMRPRFAFVLLLASSALAQPGAYVTERMQIEIDGHVQTARKINGRWFSPDNRELTRTNVGWLWNIGGGNARYLVRFDHHYPVDPSKVSLLDRSMGPDEVKAILGPPNSVFPSDRPEPQQQWDYYGPDGYKLSIKFSHSGGIFTADFEPDAKSMPQDVPHLAFRFNGKTARESYEESKQQRVSRPVPQSQAEFREQLKAEMAQRRSQLPASQVHREVVTVPAAAPVPAAPPSRKVTAEEIKAVVIGMSRADLIALLGEPASRFAISSDEGSRETLEYQTEAGSTVTTVVFKGKVSKLPR